MYNKNCLGEVFLGLQRRGNFLSVPGANNLCGDKQTLPNEHKCYLLKASVSHSTACIGLRLMKGKQRTKEALWWRKGKVCHKEGCWPGEAGCGLTRRGVFHVIGDGEQFWLSPVGPTLGVGAKNKTRFQFSPDCLEPVATRVWLGFQARTTSALYFVRGGHRPQHQDAGFCKEPQVLLLEAPFHCTSLRQWFLLAAEKHLKLFSGRP